MGICPFSFEDSRVKWESQHKFQPTPSPPPPQRASQYVTTSPLNTFQNNVIPQSKCNCCNLEKDQFLSWVSKKIEIKIWTCWKMLSEFWTGAWLYKVKSHSHILICETVQELFERAKPCCDCQSHHKTKIAKEFHAVTAGFSLVFSATGMAPFQTGKAIG